MADFKEMEAKIDKKFKELEASIFQTLGLVDPYFQRIIGEMIGRHKDAIVQIINSDLNTTDKDPKGRD